MCHWRLIAKDSHPALYAAARAASEGVIREVVYKENRAIVTIVTEITEESMVGLVDEIDRLSTQYCYRTIELRVSSPGGTGHALDYYLVALQRFREQDVVIHTRALTQACSAGAAIVSLADGTLRAAE